MDTGRGIAKPGKTEIISGEDTVRRLFVRELINLVENDGRARSSGFADEEAIHQLRVSTRRLRAKLKVVGLVLRRAPRQEFEARLGEVGAVLGELRNLGVLQRLYDSFFAGDTQLSPIQTRLDTDLEAAKRRVRRTLDSKQYRQTIERLAGWAVAPPLRARAQRDASVLFAPRLWTMTQSLFVQADEYGPQPTLDGLHQIRKLAKNGRYNYEVASWYLGTPASDVASSFEEVQRTLGDLHDLSVAVHYLEAGSSATGEMCGALRVQMTPLLAKWRAPLQRARHLSDALQRAQVSTASLT
ncbi:MAG TPA: CHAD domain-containing protein [Acidimicrobiales bacterium]|nr:CHAD domain-containing protein [Acidimicrobiales bacterium]